MITGLSINDVFSRRLYTVACCQTRALSKEVCSPRHKSLIVFHCHISVQNLPGYLLPFTDMSSLVCSFHSQLLSIAFGFKDKE